MLENSLFSPYFSIGCGLLYLSVSALDTKFATTIGVLSSGKVLTIPGEDVTVKILVCRDLHALRSLRLGEARV